MHKQLCIAAIIAVTVMACSNKNARQALEVPNSLFEQGRIVAVVATGERIELDLLYEGDELTGALPCNRAFGSTSFTENTVTIGEIGTTRMLCDPETMDHEEAVLTVLSGQAPLINYQNEEWTFGTDGNLIIIKAVEMAPQDESKITGGHNQ